jgi:hypothetical protein
MYFSVEHLELDQLRKLQSERLKNLVGYLGESLNFINENLMNRIGPSGYKVN